MDDILVEKTFGEIGDQVARLFFGEDTGGLAIVQRIVRSALENYGTLQTITEAVKTARTGG